MPMKIIHDACLYTSLLLLAVLPAVGQAPQQDNGQDPSSAERLLPAKSTSKETEYLSCWRRNEKNIKSRLVRSPVLVSSDGLHRAYVEVEATAFKPKDEATY